MTQWIGGGTHGVAFLPEIPGPGRFETVDGIPWTDVCGLRRGWSVRYRGRGSSSNWFHCPVSTIDLFGHAATSLGDVAVTFTAAGTAQVRAVHIWSGATRVHRSDGLGLAGTQTWTHLFYPELAIDHGAVNVCLLVNLGAAASDIEFSNVHARFVAA